MKKIMCLLLSVVLLFSMSSCVSFVSFDELTTEHSEGTTAYEYNFQPQETTAVYVENTTAVILPESTTVPEPSAEQTTAAQPVTPQETTLPQEITTAAPVIVPEETTAVPANPVKDYSSYSKKQIIDEYAAALGKTRAYSGNLTVSHTESFNADIKDAHPGGALTELLASNIVKLVGSEGQQTLSFSSGKATNADGETVPILLPQRTSFSLPEEGVSSASIKQTGDKLHIKLVLVPETVSMGEIPKYNSSSIGYLDTSDMDFKIITISRVDITYSGSVIDAVIRSDGYIESVTYTINMSTYAELSGMGITGYGTLEGAQTEKWQLNW